MATKEHLALYRKYRPETFDDVVGQEAIVDLLTKTIASEAIAHAYLFCGGRGTGKTTVARILARELKCNPEDIIEIDAASNRGIDEIRELREAVRSAPFSSKYKVYIIDEAHMLTKEAANAFLKTLEEPPAHAVFILATTDPEKLPQTIVSRCQKVEFQSPDLKTLGDRLVYVAKKEGKKIEEDAALLIAQYGKGSYRDALGVLEQVLLRSDVSTISEELVMELLGAPEHGFVFELLESLCKKDVARILTTLGVLEKKGVEAAVLYGELITYMRIALLSRVGEGAVLGHSLADIEEKLALLGKTYPTEISSAKILYLLDNARYINIPGVSGYVGLEMVLLAAVGA